MEFLIPDSPRLSFYEFGKLLFLPTIILMSGIQKSQSNGKGSLYILEFGFFPTKKAVYSRQLTFYLDSIFWFTVSFAMSLLTALHYNIDIIIENSQHLQLNFNEDPPRFKSFWCVWACLKNINEYHWNLNLSKLPVMTRDWKKMEQYFHF